MKALLREVQYPTYALVVEDEEKLGRFVCMLLKQAGYHAVTCQSIGEARRLLTDGQWHFVLTDIVMPRENGFDLMRWVKSNCPTLPVIAMTAHSTEAVTHQMNQFGFAAVLHKPFTIEHFYQVVQQITPTYSARPSSV
ncbi:MAG: response regulator [Caldilineaceae bacterium]|nr:response regulator [Caldilineaceae bacterium]